MILLFFTMLILSKEISTYALEGLDLAVKLILPSVFPFLLITDVLITSIRAEKVTVLHRAFERIFRISGEGIATFFCGILCGFPVGAKMSTELYKNGIISKCECERLMSFSNNASPAYVIFVERKYQGWNFSVFYNDHFCRYKRIYNRNKKRKAKQFI